MHVFRIECHIYLQVLKYFSKESTEVNILLGANSFITKY